MCVFRVTSKLPAYKIELSTLAKDQDFDAYVRRSLTVIRSNTVIEGLKHYIEEGAIGVPHYGFLIFEDCANITVKDTNITARADGSGKYVSNYEMNLTRVANGTLINLIQMNDFNEYSTMGSNYCKNLVFDGCRLNRIDAHASVTNLTVRNCEVGFSRINVGGFGTLLVENTTSHGNHFITFRGDYGGSWDGDVIIRNCTWIPEETTEPLEIMDGSNPETWDFGYECYFTRTLTIDGLHIHNSEENPTVYVFTNPAPYYNDKITYRVYKHSIKYPYIMPGKVEVSGVTYEYTAADGTEQLAISPNMYIFEIGKTEFYIDGVQQKLNN